MKKTILVIDDVITSLLDIEEEVENAGLDCVISYYWKDATYKVDECLNSLVGVIVDLNTPDGKFSGWNWLVKNFLNKGKKRELVAFNSLIFSAYIPDFDSLSDKIVDGKEKELYRKIAKISKDDPKSFNKLSDYLKKFT